MLKMPRAQNVFCYEKTSPNSLYLCTASGFQSRLCLALVQFFRSEHFFLSLLAQIFYCLTKLKIYAILVSSDAELSLQVEPLLVETMVSDDISIFLYKILWKRGTGKNAFFQERFFPVHITYRTVLSYYI